MTAASTGAFSGHDGRRSDRWAGLLLAGAVALSSLNLLGWVLQIPLLRGMGNPDYAIPPFPTLIFLFVAAGAAMVHLRQVTAARTFIGVALAVLLLVIAQYVAALDLGMERLLFPRQVEELKVFNRGFPGIAGTVMLVIDCAAILLITSSGALPRSLAVLLASLSLAFTALLGTIMLTGVGRDPESAFLSRAAINAFANFMLAGGILLHALKVRPEPKAGLRYHLLQGMWPAIIVLPVLPSIIEQLTIDSGILPMNEAQIIEVICTILIVSLLVASGLRVALKQRDEVRVREQQLRSILAGVPDAVIIIGCDGRSREFSAAAARLWLIAPEVPPGCTMADYLGEREGAKLSRLLASGRTEFLLTGEGVRTDGTRFPLEMRGSRFEGIEGEACFTLFVRDLTEKLAAEQQLARLGAQLAQVSRHNAMGELAADLAHELNQPLTAAINYLSTVGYVFEQRGDETNMPEMVGQARSQVARAGDIIRRMREFAQYREVEKRAEPLLPMIEDAMKLVLVGMGGHHVEIELAVEPPELEVFVDRIHFQQVAVNLMRNAVEAIRSSERGCGKIVITAHRVGREWVQLEFTDDGPGVPESILDQLFERFTSTKAGAGMGIGLSISRRIVEAHGGAMLAVNGEPRGATFSFTLPAALVVAAE